MIFPDEALEVLRRLEEAGYEAWFVGGAVRDRVLGREAADVDITTSATPSEIEAVFAGERTLDVGKSFGTIRVVMPQAVYEVTTYRAERNYIDGRHPETVEYSRHIEDDLKRRDFTMNAMAWHPERGLLDLYGGRQDLAAGLLRAVGVAAERMEEDGLRMLRAVRFASRFAMKLEPSLRKAIIDQHTQIERISVERCYEELERMLTEGHPDRAVDLLAETGLWEALFPELPAANVSRPLLCAVADDAASRWAAVGSGNRTLRTREVEENTSAEREAEAKERAKRMTEILHRFKASTKRSSDVRLLLEARAEVLPQTLPEARKWQGEHPKDTRRILQFLAEISPVLYPEGAWRTKTLESITHTSALIDIIEESHLPVSIKDLAIRGEDLLALGMKPGKRVGTMLLYLLDQVIEEKLENTTSRLCEAARRKLEEGENG